MEEELKNFIKVWLSIFASLVYCHSIGKVVLIGTKRLLFLLPIIFLFLFLPFNLFTINLVGGTSFFICLTIFKLLLFSFGKGPLASDPPISLTHFITIACLPIDVKQNPTPKALNLQKLNQNDQFQTDPSAQSSCSNGQFKQSPPPKPSREHKSPLNYAIKGLLLAIVLRVIDYRDHFHPKLVMFLYCGFIYLILENVLAIVGVLARALLGLELEPHFNEPYLSTSLQDFWGKRWNLVVSRTLRLAVYNHTLNLSTRFVHRKWAPLPAVFGTFLASGLMHEFIYYLMGRVSPTWEVTCFFVLHGFCVQVEIVLKKALKGRCRLPTLISIPLSVGFVMATCFWLFFPQFLRCKADVRMFDEYAAVGAMLRNICQVIGQRIKGLFHVI